MNSNEEILALLSEATKGMLLVSEVDYPLDPFIWAASGSISVSQANIRELTHMPEDCLLEECELAFLFRHVMVEKSWQNEEEVQLVKRFQSLYRLLNNILSDIKVFRLGRIEISVYIIGRAPSGDLAGLITKQFET